MSRDAAVASPSPAAAWAKLLACVAARAYLAVLAGLLVWTVLPMVAGWQTSMVMTGSMAPSLQPGDAIVRQPATAATVQAGQVLVVDDPDHAGRLRAHRLREVRPDGTFILRGDANPQDDSTPVKPSAVRGLARLRIPYIALPAVWLRTGRAAEAAGWLLLTGAAALAATLPTPGGRQHRQDDDRDEDGDGSAGERPPAVRRGLRTAAALPVGALLLAVPGGTGVAFAAYTARTSNPTSSFAAAASFCTAPSTTTVTAGADAYVDQATPTGNFGTSSFLRVRSAATANQRALVSFALPAAPAGCSVTAASLALSVRSGAAGRTLKADPAAAAWTETGVTWANQPNGLSTPALAPSSASAVNFTVTTQVQAMYAGSNYGFIISDAVEDAPSGVSQTFSPREFKAPPQLSITFG